MLYGLQKAASQALRRLVGRTVLMLLHNAAVRSQGNAGQLLYNSTALRCSDNLNDGMQRLSRAIQQLSMTSFFGSIGFNKQGQNYAGSIGLAQVWFASMRCKAPLALPGAANLLPVHPMMLPAGVCCNSRPEAAVHLPDGCPHFSSGEKPGAATEEPLRTRVPTRVLPEPG